VHGPVRRGREIPLVGRLALVVGVLAVAVLVLYIGAGGVGFLANTLGGTVTKFVGSITATPTPIATLSTVADAPSIESPSEPYTNQHQVDLVVTVPSRLAGSPDYRVRVYLALKDQPPAAIDEKPLAATPKMIIPVTLENGINDFSVTLVGPAGESESSPLARWIFDANPPGIKLSSPKDGAEINRKAVTIDGRTQARSTILIRNTKTNDSISGTAAADGTFALAVPIASGSNVIHIAVTDPAGNDNTLDLTVRRGSGRLRASIASSVYSIYQKDLPTDVRLTVLVDDPDGSPLAGARVTFTLSLPGIPTITGDAITDENGQAVMATKVPKGASKGSGSAAVLVQTTDFGKTTDETPISIKK
jgi:hypothetical protein